MPLSAETRTKATDLFPKPALEQVTIVRSVTPFEPIAQVRDLPFWGRPGWARFTAGAVLTKAYKPGFDDIGWLTMAEWDEDGISHMIRPDPEHTGGLLHLTLQETQHANGGAELAWREVVRVTGQRAAAGLVLVYHVYLIDEGDGAIRRACDAFVGLEGGNA